MTAITQDAFFSQLFQTGLSDPDSKAYLPDMILETTDPNLNPYTMSSLDLGSQNFMGISLDVKLSNLSISGIPNISVAAADGGVFALTDLLTNFTGVFGVLKSPPKGAEKMIFASHFVLSNAGETLDGDLSVTISTASLTGTVTISGSQLENIVTTVNTVKSVVPASATVKASVTFSPSSPFFEQAMEQFLEDPDTVQMVVDQVNEQIQEPATLDSLSKELTTILQSTIKEQLG